MAITKNQLSAVNELSSLLKAKPSSLLNKNAALEKNNQSILGKTASYSSGHAPRKNGVVAKHKPKAPSTQGTSIVKMDDPIGTATVTCGALNVRSAPGNENPRIGGLTNGKTISVYEESGDWIRIGYGTGFGWVLAKYTTYQPTVVEPPPGPDPQPDPPEPDPPEPAFEPYDVVTTTGLRLRDKPGNGEDPAPDSTILETMPQGTRVTVLEEQNGWYRVKYNDKEGWCCANYTNKIVPVEGGGKLPEGAEGYAYDVPIDGQDTNYNCGAASSAMALAARGLNITEQQVAQQAGTNSSGSIVWKLCAALNHFIGSDVFRYTDVKSYSTEQFHNTLTSSLSVTCMPVFRISTVGYKHIFGYESSGHYVCCTGAYRLNGEMRTIVNDPFSGGWGGNGHQGQKLNMLTADFHQCGKNKGEAWLIHGG